MELVGVEWSASHLVIFRGRTSEWALKLVWMTWRRGNSEAYGDCNTCLLVFTLISSLYTIYHYSNLTLRNKHIIHLLEICKDRCYDCGKQ
jgi:hypothetical protein